MTVAPISRIARLAANATWQDVEWAREQLRPHAGKSVRFEVWPVGFPAVTLAISPEGNWQDAAPGQVPEATVRVTPGLLPRLALAPDKLGAALAPDSIGDPALVRTLHDLHDVLPLAFEEKISSLLGPLMAHGIAAAARSVAMWPRYAAERVGAGLAAYWTQENATLAARPAFESFRDELAVLAQRVEALASRTERAA